MSREWERNVRAKEALLCSSDLKIRFLFPYILIRWCQHDFQFSHTPSFCLVQKRTRSIKNAKSKLERKLKWVSELAGGVSMHSGGFCFILIKHSFVIFKWDQAKKCTIPHCALGFYNVKKSDGFSYVSPHFPELPEQC